MRGKLSVKHHGGRKFKIKIRYMVLALTLLAATLPRVTYASDCHDVKIIFARGSGAERWNDQNYLAFKTAIESKLAATSLSYEFIDLDYPAVGVGIENLGVSLGALFGAGEAYEFGDSVKSGVKKLDNLVNSSDCPNTKYVLGGYSQGAMVVSRAIGSLDSGKIIYAATFGDPKIYLPEGKGLLPAACRGDNLSDYRMYVPDCQAYKGLLGAYIPYEPDNFAGKVGVWCNKRDIFCSSHFNISDHLAYVSENLYEDAARVIFDKICKTFGLENRISSPHDTAILIDSTGSMMEMINKYKTEALRLAKETLSSGGRVALYDYRDLGDPYTPVKHCDFNTCTIEKFKSELNKIVANNGGDTPESLLSAAFHAMSKLEWNYGSTKSLVVLTDANFLSPDRDGIRFDEVVELSKKIDPVNFYIITTEEFAGHYETLAAKTGGKVVTNFNELNLLTDYIMERYDSLPRVEENVAIELPMLEVTDVEYEATDSAKITIKTTGTKVLVALNDAILGIAEMGGTSDNTVTIYGLDSSVPNIITLVPLNDDTRGEAVEVILSLDGRGSITSNDETIIVETKLPKAPNTGRR